MKTRIFIIAGLILFSSWNINDDSTTEANVNGSKVTVCTLEKVKSSAALPLGSLVENCTLIQFDNKDEALISPWFTTVSDKYIGIRQRSNGAFKLFDRSGKFLCNVGAMGQGPGEYASSSGLYDEIIDDRNNLVYLACFTDKKILVYNTSGKFLKNIEIPQRLNKPKMHLAGGILSLVHMPFPDSRAFALQISSDGKVVNEIAAPEHLISHSFDGEIFNSRNTSAFEFTHTNSDTLYHYDIAGNKLIPVFTLKSKSEQLFVQYIELKDKFLSNTFGKGIVLTDKKTKTSSKFDKIRNDYFGNLEIPVNVSTFRNGWFVHNIEPGDLIDLVEARLKESDCSEKDKQALNKLLSTLDAKANNVLFIGKLK